MKISKKLKEIIIEDKDSLAADVARTALRQYGKEDEEIEAFFSDLFRGGCASGMISHLIYYKDTHKYFISHLDEIQEIAEELVESTGEPLNVQGDIPNWYAWLGFEETARKVAGKLEIEC